MIKRDYTEFTNFKGIGFELDQKAYIYDMYSNQILKVDSIIIDIIDDSFLLSDAELKDKYKFKYSIDALEIACSNISLMKEKLNIFRNFVIPSLSISSRRKTIDKVIDKLSSELTQLVINVSENCNLRCSYCVYSGCYKNRRSHNKLNDMPWELAKRSIDFFVKRSNRAKDRFITFYGGEPLLRFDFIKDAATYARAIAPDIQFSMTTNATLLDEAKLKFFSDYSFELVISLDGPESIHNRFRKFSNNQGTFDVVMGKLELIKDKFPDIFASKLKINAVLSPHNEEIDILNDFFQPVPNSVFSMLSGENRLSMGSVNPDENSFVVEYGYNDFLNKCMTKTFQIYKAHFLKSIDVSDIPVLRALLNREIKLIHTRSNKRFADFSFYWPNGICIPGMRSLFVSSDGNFYPCEKLYDYREMSIGNIDEGFNFSKIAEYIDGYIKFSFDDCSKCWGFRFCSQCFIQVRQSGEFNQTKRLPYCIAHRSYIVAYLKLYISIREQNPDAFKYLEDLPRDNVKNYINSMLED